MTGTCAPIMEEDVFPAIVVRLGYVKYFNRSLRVSTLGDPKEHGLCK